jgi:hypothetical protein
VAERGDLIRRREIVKSLRKIHLAVFVVDIFAVDMVKYSEILKGGIET